MRYSHERKFSVKLVRTPRRRKRAETTHEKLLEAVEKATTADDRRGGILLVGGRGADDVAIRQAQAGLRFDRLPSYWSRAAIILRWPDEAAPGKIIGVEVPTPLDVGEDVVPERNGARIFTLDKYVARADFPNMAFGTLRVRQGPRSKRGVPAEMKDSLCAAALNPLRECTRFRLYEWLGHWSRFCLAGGPSPLEEHVPHPGAALCEYVYGTAGLDLCPGLTEPGGSPEVIWNTLLFWHEQLDLRTKSIGAWASILPDESPTRQPRGPSLEDDFDRLRRSRARRRR